MKTLQVILVLALLDLLSHGGALKILNSSPVPPGRTVLFSLSSTLSGSLEFNCADLSKKVRRINKLYLPEKSSFEDQQFAVLHAPFSFTTNVTCTVTNGKETESATTEVIVDVSQMRLRHRREIRDITDEERNTYFNAILELKRTYVYEYFVQSHGAANQKPARNPGEEECEVADFALAEPCTNSQRNIAHNGPFFPVWHREFVSLFEDALIMVNPEDKTLAGHYWDWTRDSETGYSSEIFTSKFYGSCDPEEMENPGLSGAQVIDGPFTFENFPVRSISMGMKMADEVLRRAPGKGRQGGLPTSNQQEMVVCSSLVYDLSPWETRVDSSWRDALEGNNQTVGSFHGAVHGWVSGHLVDVNYSPNDPLFFGHHTQLDRVFYAWQLKHPEQIYLPRAGDESAPPLHTSDQTLWPMGRTPDDVWELAGFAYDLDELLAYDCD